MPIRNFLIVYNWREHELDHWRDLSLDIKTRKLSEAESRELYRDYEQRFRPSDGYEVVLLGADSIDTIRRTHGHYFGANLTDPFVELLDEK